LKKPTKVSRLRIFIVSSILYNRLEGELYMPEDYYYCFHCSGKIPITENISSSCGKRGRSFFGDIEIDLILIIVGIIFLLLSLSMDTSVSTGTELGKVHNGGLLNERTQFM
jgi:hypothetical protein